MVKTDNCMGVYRFLGERAPGMPSKVYAYMVGSPIYVPDGIGELPYVTVEEKPKNRRKMYARIYFQRDGANNREKDL